MGMDGISISNTGVVKEQTSAEYANKVEQSVVLDPKNSAQQVQEPSSKELVREREESDRRQKRQNQDEYLKEEFQDGLVEEPETNDEEEQNFDVEDFENPEKDFYVKLNIKDDIIELYDSSNERLIETISGSELGELVKKLNMASGIFVNKRV